MSAEKSPGAQLYRLVIVSMNCLSALVLKVKAMGNAGYDRLTDRSVECILECIILAHTPIMCADWARQ